MLLAYLLVLLDVLALGRGVWLFVCIVVLLFVATALTCDVC